jgi:hypothetical protein
MRIEIRPLVIAGGLAVAALLPIGHAAAQGGAQQQERARLEQRAARIHSQLGEKTGAMQRVKLRKQREEIDAAIEQIQAGKRVSPEEIDRILDETSVDRYE